VNTLFPSTLALLDMDFSHIIPVVAIIAPFMMIICVSVAKSIARTQQERMRCEVMRAAIERGQPIPPEALRPLPDDEDDSCGRSRPPSPQNDIRAGMICIGVGVGLYLMLATFSIGGFDGLHGLRWVGAIPGFIGVALLAYGLIQQSTGSSSRPMPGQKADSTREPRH